jgi:2-polyprenyl-3-methyl-5-hydroxy-6-metoxy-1,4-benzoquinol methylase
MKAAQQRRMTRSMVKAWPPDQRSIGKDIKIPIRGKEWCDIGCHGGRIQIPLYRRPA